jgi:hypothetical protein
VITFKAGTLESLFDPNNLTASVYAAKSQSDLDGDGDVDIDDLALFSKKWLKVDWQTIDWCQWLQQDSKTKRRMGQELINFILDYFNCNAPDPLIVINKNDFPTRLAYGPDGKLFVSDARVGSVFIYDITDALIGEIKGINQPLGVAINSSGNIYVGSNGDDNVKVYNSKGEYINSVGSVGMPNDMVFDKNENLYVIDSVNNEVKVYDPQGNEATFSVDAPIALAIKSYTDGNGQEIEELYVAEKKLARISVFDLQGNILRSFGRKVSTFGSFWHGRFVKIQSLAIDNLGRVHALDCYLNKVQILDPQAGTFISSYPFGDEPDHTILLLDIAIKVDHQTAVTNYGKKQVEIIGGW